MINVFFGKVVDVQDDEKIFRLRIAINGYTNELATEDLPWYFPMFGFHYIPIVGDVVPVLIFNGNFTTGFYIKKIDLESTGLEGTEYENYLEIYKRLGVELSYKESVGIQLINANSRLQIEELRASMYVKDNQITMDDKRIDLGTDGEATPLGDKTVKALVDLNTQNKNDFTETMKLFDAIKKACTSPMLAPIKIALTVAMPSAKSKMDPSFPKNEKFIKTIQSKKTFIE